MITARHVTVGATRADADAPARRQISADRNHPASTETKLTWLELYPTLMPNKRPPGSLGLDLRTQSLRPCGLCGETRKMSKAHVPPRAAGNGSYVTSAIVIISRGVLRPGRHAAGGLWLRGLCAECNSLAGARYDDAYAEFSNRLRSYMQVSLRSYFALPSGAPAVSVAPGLVARSVMFGMFAISPNLRIMFPDLAEQLKK